jgi:hypothetical protein
LSIAAVFTPPLTGEARARRTLRAADRGDAGAGNRSRKRAACKTGTGDEDKLEPRSEELKRGELKRGVPKRSPER